MSEWWVGRQGANPVGPVTTGTLVRGIVEKKVPEDALVCRVGDTEWKQLPQVTEIWELIHPEQQEEEHTHVTKRPWFDEKANEPSDPPEPIVDSDDESTRVLTVPIMPMRTIDVDTQPKAAEKPKPTPRASAAPAGASRPQSAVTSGGADPGKVQPSQAGIPTVSKAGLHAAPGFSAPRSSKAAAAPVGTRTAPLAAAPPAPPSPKGVIAPPRFGTERVSTRPASPSVAPSPMGAQEPAGNQAPSAPNGAHPTAGASVSDSEPAPDSDEAPSVPLIAVRPNPVPQRTPQTVPLRASRPAMPSTSEAKGVAPAASRPAMPTPSHLFRQSHASDPKVSAPAASRPAMPTPPQLLRQPHPSEAKINAPPPPPPPAAPPPIIVGHPQGPVDYDDDTVTVIAKSPIAASQPASPAAAPTDQYPPPPPPAPAPREHTPIMPMFVQKPPAALAQEAGGAPPSPPNANKHTHITQRSGKPPTVPPPPPEATFQSQPSAVAKPLPSAPKQPEIAPSDLLDEDFEAPPAPPKVAPAPDQNSVRPAAGTPAPPSVIVTHRPPSMHDELLSQAVPHLNEETRPAMRSLRAPGTVQVSIGALIIGALVIIVVMLAVVLVLR